MHRDTAAMRGRLSLALLILVFTHLAAAQVYPDRPIRIVVPFPPGGGADIVSRQITYKLGERLGQQVVIDNRSGAGGVIGTDIEAKAPPDGYTLLMISSSHTVNPSLYKNLPYDSVRDFSPVTMLVSAPAVLVVHPAVAAKTVKELIALAKAKPGSLAYASAGNGTAAHLAGELFRSLTGAQIVHVPYKGIASALVAALAGEVQITFGSQPSTIPYMKEGKLRALAVTSAQRSRFTPDIPTIAESGVPDYATTTWNGVLAPAKTPRPIVARLYSEFAKVLDLPEIKAGLASQNFEIVGSTPDKFSAFIRVEIDKWSKVVKDSGMRID